MGKDFKKVEDFLDGEIIYDSGEYTFNPKNYTPYKYLKSRDLNKLKELVRKSKL